MSGQFLLNICLGDASTLFVAVVSSLNVCLPCCMNLILLTHSLSLKSFIYLAVSDLNCSLQDLSLRHAESAVASAHLRGCGVWARQV